MGSFRQDMTWLHTWSGLCVGWVLYFVFLTGTLGYVDTEIDRWMQPELSPERSSGTEAAEVAQSWLATHAPGAHSWLIIPPTHRDYPLLTISWDDAQGDRPNGSALLDVATAQPPETRATGGGQALYRMHYLLHYMPALFGQMLVGICSMIMLISFLTGIVSHKRIFTDFFTFRHGRRQRSWLDLHVLLGVFALPYHLMITYTGLVFLAFAYMPLIIVGSYGSGADAQRSFFQEILPDSFELEPAGIQHTLVSLADVVTQAEEIWGKDQVYYLDIHHPDDVNATITAGRVNTSPLRGGDKLHFSGSGELLVSEPLHTTTGPRDTREFMLGLHEGLFGGPLLRVLFLLSGLAGTLLIAAGLILWSVKVENRHTRRGEALPRRYQFGFSLNVATVAGLPLAIAAYFWANRLLPLDLPDRADWELHCLFLTWLATLLHACLRPPARAWSESFACAALAYSLLPLLNALTTERHLGVSLAQGDWVMAGFDLSMLATGLVFAGVAWLSSRSRFSADRSIPLASP